MCKTVGENLYFRYSGIYSAIPIASPARNEGSTDHDARNKRRGPVIRIANSGVEHDVGINS